MNEVEAVKSRNEIAAIETLLRKHHGELYADLWKIGLNLSLRISDLLAIRVCRPGPGPARIHPVLLEGKTGKRRKIRLNNTALKVINRRQQGTPGALMPFCSRSSRTGPKGKPISRNSVSRAFKDAGDRIGLRINTHSMRKSRGYVMFSDGVPIEKVSKVLNHSHPAVTMRYLGITNKEVLDSYDEYEL